MIVVSDPGMLYQALPFEVRYTPYDLTHVLTQIQLLLFSALAFVWLNKRGIYPPELNAVHLDVDWSYRRLLPDLATQRWTGRTPSSFILDTAS